ncbi:hypothetical protein Ae201684P_003623 [Aphanomyces euteiches]|uniref:Uncharacterized protein n=1 Tax=Aphanomyces euteiches TaxID=100861 RepID=A0A6G0WNR2_9STRA|nr:hypothetical protein Ae201684_013288 [Aphanomyces euteiches]KAH9064842.1 hypothetical protein Ae201684P_003623 [Aphanomyces euteiches]
MKSAESALPGAINNDGSVKVNKGQVQPLEDTQAFNTSNESREPLKAVSSVSDDRPKPKLAFYEPPGAHGDEPQSDYDGMTRHEKVEVALGMLYLVFTLVLSVYYLSILSPSMWNDLWWAQFNATWAQSYLIDLFNTQLNLGVNGSLDLTSKMYGLPKDYSQFYTPIAVSPIYPRLVFDSKMYNLAEIIAALRLFPSPERVITQYCWLDWHRRWEVAHTDLRQKRCYARYINNGAAYWETSLRLIDWNAYMAGAFGLPFNTTMGNALRKTEDGRQWLTTTPYAFVSVDAEVAQWEQANLTRFQFHITNGNMWGVHESFTIGNAFGKTQTISIKRMPYVARGALWTTIYMYLANPATYACVPCDPAWNPNPASCKPDFEMFLALPNTPCFQLVRSNIGALNSIDLYYVRPPTSLTLLYTTFRNLVAELVQSDDTFAAVMGAIPSLPIDPVPPSWLQPSFMYMGGDPTCTQRQPTTFVQSSFSFFVSCSTSDRQKILLNPLNALFALWVTSLSSVSKVCDVCPTQNSSCSAVMGAASQAAKLLIKAYPPTTSSYNLLILGAYNDVIALGVRTVQLAINTSDLSNRFLRQPVLGGEFAAVWDLYGWIYMYEWAETSREVLSFEGDANVLLLISNKYDSIVNQAQGLEVKKSACQYLWVISVVVSTILLFVGCILTFYCLFLRFRMVGRNLFQFNRVVGPVWLGRPLLLVRGMTAIVLLSTSPMNFQKTNGYSHLEFKPRSHFESMVVAGEATWISYVIIDCLLLLRRGSEYHWAPISTWIGWLALVIIDIQWPYVISTKLN